MTERYLEGRHAIVTGGGRGIGAAIADALAQRGCVVTITGRDLDTLRTTAQQVAAEHGVTVAALACDVTDEEEVRNVFAVAQNDRGDAFILINNAGQSEGSPFLETTRELWDRMLAVNLTGAYSCTQQVLGGMLRAREGRIVNIASTSGLKGYRNITAYCASKHGLVGFTRALAAETTRAGITVNAVCPAYTDTAMAARAVDTVVRDMDRSAEQARELIARSVPRGTLITPGEVAATVAWLCSPEASGINGQAVTIAGGEI
ncbi:MAG TPA: SDR family NAD(P)-dependent oxidoreductase [Longimicrobiales bacterium]|nr:SDR family NAD(P)-dependent oxidoreductase [Longimicrobiales bacterium]